MYYINMLCIVFYCSLKKINLVSFFIHVTFSSLLVSFPNTVEVRCQVTGVVGRAELLSSIFYLWALMMYANCIGKDRHTGMSGVD